MKVLIACEESQEVCKAFRALGHEAYSCDIQEPSGGHPEWHILGDALEAVKGGIVTTMDGVSHNVGKWDLLIAHPPCTYLSNAGARHLWKNHQLQAERVMCGIKARDFFMEFYRAPIPMKAIENPIPSKVFVMPEYSQIIQPYQFGHPYTKKTCLWLWNLPKLVPTNIVEPVATWCPSGSYSHKHGEQHKGMFTTDRAKNREKTFPGIAITMAEQWGGDTNFNPRTPCGVRLGKEIKGVDGIMERLTFDGNFCDIAMCRENPCPYNGSCSQRKVWERLKAYEDTGLTPGQYEGNLEGTRMDGGTNEV